MPHLGLLHGSASVKNHFLISIKKKKKSCSPALNIRNSIRGTAPAIPTSMASTPNLPIPLPRLSEWFSKQMVTTVKQINYSQQKAWRLGSLPWRKIEWSGNNIIWIDILLKKIQLKFLEPNMLCKERKLKVSFLMPETLQSLCFWTVFFLISLLVPNIIFYLAAKTAKHLFPLSTAATIWIKKK